MNERVWQLQGQVKVLAKEIDNQRKYDDVAHLPDDNERYHKKKKSYQAILHQTRN